MGSVGRTIWNLNEPRVPNDRGLTPLSDVLTSFGLKVAVGRVIACFAMEVIRYKILVARYLSH